MCSAGGNLFLALAGHDGNVQVLMRIGVAPERVPVSLAATGGWDYLASLEAAHTAARLWM